MSQFPDDPDGEALELLAAQGVDMTQPIRIEFAVTAADEPAAQAIEAALLQAGYQAVAEYDDGEPLDDDHVCDESCDHGMELADDAESSDEESNSPGDADADDAEWNDDESQDDEFLDEDGDEEEFAPSWTVYVSITMVPDYDAVIRVQQELEQHVREIGGVVDGWGVMLGEESP